VEDYKYISVAAIIKLNDLSGVSKYEDNADYDLVKLMMQSEFVTINNKTIRVTGVEVTSKGSVNFYGKEVPRYAYTGTIPFDQFE
jgi:hypothetical protein